MENIAKKVKCIFCDSEDTEVVTKRVTLKGSFGEEIAYDQKICRCKNCGEDNDITNEEESDKAIRAYEGKSFGVTISELLKKGYSLAQMERALDLPVRTISRWSAGNLPSAAGKTLFKFIRLMPWLIEVGDNDFDVVYARGAIVNAALNEFDRLRKANEEDPQRKGVFVRATRTDEHIDCCCIVGATMTTTAIAGALEQRVEA